MDLRKCWPPRFGFPRGSALPERHARGEARPWWERSRCSVPRVPRAARPMRLPGSRLALAVALAGGRKSAGLHRFVETGDRIRNIARTVPEWANEFRMEIDIHSEEILQYQNLAIAANAGADADRRNAQAASDLMRELRRN